MSTKQYSNRQEHKIAEELGWKVVSGSGSRDFYPGDVESDKWLGECKTHMRPMDKIKFMKMHWSKISEEAMSKFKSPALFVDDGTQRLDRTWCMIPNILPEHVHRVPYIKPQQENLSFSNSEGLYYLRKSYDNFSKSTYSIESEIAMQLQFCDTDVCILPFALFHKLFGVNNLA